MNAATLSMTEKLNEKKNEMPDDSTSSARSRSPVTFVSTAAFLRRNPVATALGLCAAGFVAGVVTGHVRKSS